MQNKDINKMFKGRLRSPLHDHQLQVFFNRYLVTNSLNNFVLQIIDTQ